jgi:hypothetical protein
MLLTEKQITQIYKDFKGKKVSLKSLNKLYKINTEPYIYFLCFIDFYRGGKYDYDGLLTKEEYQKVLKMFEDGKELHLGEVNGKHSDVNADINDMKFFDGSKNIDKQIVEKYIFEHGTHTDLDYFLDHFGCEDELNN